MITLEQHLAAHWPTVHTHAGLHWSHMYQCKCGWMPPQDDPDPIESIHAAHVAATWREARTVRTVEELEALPFGAVIREAVVENHRATGADWNRVWEKWHEGKWVCPGDHTEGTQTPALPAVILWTPEDVA